jgi:NAD(P)-dependent dehydrogenase (short-subunit alcohol dehydrogenase family)
MMSRVLFRGSAFKNCMKTWFITGASRGFGHEWTRAALARGDRRAQIETNLFGALWVTQAALPFLGERTDKRVLSPGPSSHFIVLSLAERGGSGLHSAAQGWLSSRGPPLNVLFALASAVTKASRSQRPSFDRQALHLLHAGQRSDSAPGTY